MKAPAIVLTANKPAQGIALSWSADQCQIYNQTPSAIWVRLGSSAPPQSDLSADVTIPPGDIVNLPVSSNELGFAFADPTALASAPLTTIGGIGNKATIVISKDERSLGASSLAYASLALSVATVGNPATNGILGPFDLAQWGGLICSAYPTVNDWDQHGYITYQTSSDALSWVDVARLPIWPGMVLNAQLPRIRRYSRLFWQTYGVPWDANATFNVTARPTLTEILSIVPVLNGPLPEWSYGPLTAGGFESKYAPGDLVDSINYYFDLRTVVNTAVSVSLTGSYPTGGSAAQTTFSRVLNAAGTDAIHGTLDAPWPRIWVFFLDQDGIANAAGKWGMVPRMLAGPPDITGQPGDAAGSDTLPGLLATIVNADQSILTATLPRAGMHITGPQNAVAAGVFFNTLTDLPLGERIYALSYYNAAAAGTQTIIGIGTAAGVTDFLIVGTAPQGQIAIGQPTGLDYTGKRRVWLFSAAAAVVSANIWTA